MATWLHRELGQSLRLRSTDPMFPRSLAAVTYRRRENHPNAVTEVTSPASALTQLGEINEENFWIRQFFFLTPVDRHKTRLCMFTLTSTSYYDPEKYAASGGIKKLTPWVSHWAMSDALDGDCVFLQMLEQNLSMTKKKQWTAKTYFTPASSDKLINTYRRWLHTKGGGGPFISDGEVPSVPRKELLNRYDSHVSECKVCQAGLKFYNRVMAVSKLLSQCALLLCTALVFKSLQGTLAYWKAALPLIPYALFVLIERHIREKWIPRFYFVDYVHAEKN